MTVALRLAIEAYECRDCLREHGVHVGALIRMIPSAALMDGEVVGTEAWCCPNCFRPKFDLKKKPFNKKG